MGILRCFWFIRLKRLRDTKPLKKGVFWHKGNDRRKRAVPLLLKTEPMKSSTLPCVRSGTTRQQNPTARRWYPQTLGPGNASVAAPNTITPPGMQGKCFTETTFEKARLILMNQ